MTPQQEPLSGVIICPAIQEGQRLTALSEIAKELKTQLGELLHRCFD
jgi:hypothetical protein